MRSQGSSVSVLRDSLPLATGAESDEDKFSCLRSRDRALVSVATVQHLAAGVPCDRALAIPIDLKVERLARSVGPAVLLAGHSQRIARRRIAVPPHGTAVVLGALGKLVIIHPIRVTDGRRGEPEQQTHGEAWYDHHATSERQGTAATASGFYHP